eukprot:gene26694-biopygen17162
MNSCHEDGVRDRNR